MRSFTKGRHLVLKMFCAAIVTTAAMVGFAAKPAQAETIERIYEFRSYWEGNQNTSSSHHQWRRAGQEWQTLADTNISMHFNHMVTYGLDTITTNGRKFKIYVNDQLQDSSLYADTSYIQVSTRIEHFNSFPTGYVTMTNEQMVFGNHRQEYGNDYKTNFYYDVKRAISQNVASNQAQTDQWARDPYNNGNGYTLKVKVVFEDDQQTISGGVTSTTSLAYKDTGEDYNGEWTNKDLVLKTSLSKSAQTLDLRRNSKVVNTLSNTSSNQYAITQETDYTWRYYGDHYVYYYKLGAGSLSHSTIYKVKIDKTKPELNYGWDANGLLTDKSSDGLSGIAKVEIYVNGQWHTVRLVDEEGNETEGSGTFQFDNANVTQHFRYRVTDKAGNVVEESGTFKANTNKEDSKSDPVTPADPVKPGDGSGNNGDGFSAKLVS